MRKHTETKHFHIENGVASDEESSELCSTKSKPTLDMECKICNKFFKSRGYGTHMKMHMVEKKKFICNICNKSFQKNSHLERHVRIHTGKK